MHTHAHDIHGRRLWYAVVINLALTAVQVVAGVLSGSLALIADALHNFSDAASLVLAYVARRIARRPADERMTFGYGKAEGIAALINFTTLILIGFFLVGEALARLWSPEPVHGWTMVAVAAVALVVDAGTAWLTHTGARHSLNLKAAFLHNLADALASVGVIVAGVLVLVLDWRLADPIVTLGIAGFVLYHGVGEIGAAIRALMLATPKGLSVRATVAAMERVDGVCGVHHVHLWAIDERRSTLEAHVVTDRDEARDLERIKRELKGLLAREFGIGHSTLEFEYQQVEGECGGMRGCQGCP